MNNSIQPIRDRKIRFAFAGCGRISKNHFDAIKSHPDDAELVAICDPDPNALKEASNKTGLTACYASYTDMIKESQADVVVLATPSGHHAEQTIEAAHYGLHVISEKPMATRWHDGLRMVKACDDANVYLFVVKQNRYNPTLQHLKKAINDNRFGKIYMVNVNVFWSRPQSYYDSADWRGTWELDGGAFMNQASHYIDLLTWLIGPIERVQACIGTLGRNIEVEDSGVMNIRWRSGALGSVNVTMLTYRQNLEGSITILGQQGTVRIGGVAVNEIQVWDFLEKHELDNHIQSSNYTTSSVYGYGHSHYYKNVIQVLRGEAKPETDGREGLKSLEILTATYMSAKNDTPVTLPLNNE